MVQVFCDGKCRELISLAADCRSGFNLNKATFGPQFSRYKNTFC